MSRGVIIRPGELADLPAIRVMVANSFAENPVLQDLTPDLDHCERYLKAEPSLVTYVAEAADGSLVGAIVGQLLRGIFYREIVMFSIGFYVVPKMRGARVPIRLLRQLEARAMEEGCAQVWMSTVSPRMITRHAHLFAGLGYTLTGVTAVKTVNHGHEFRRLG